MIRLWYVVRLAQTGIIGSVIVLHVFVLLAPSSILDNFVIRLWDAAFYLFSIMGIMASIVMINGPDRQRGWMGLLWSIGILLLAPFLCASLRLIHGYFSSLPQ